MRDDLRLAAVAARVVAWHNRHPLARRIAAAHVHAVGYVGLPFVGEAGSAVPPSPLPTLAEVVASDDAGMVDLTSLEAGAGEEAALETGSLRERAQARARQQASAAAWPPSPAGAAQAAPAGDEGPVPPLSSLQPDFSEVFIDTLPPRRVARFAARVGQVLSRPPNDGPVRQVAAEGAHPGRQPARVYLLTAVIETGTRKSRVLLGAGLSAPVLGARVLDTPRLAGVAGLTALLVGAPAWWLRPVATPPVPGPLEAVAASSAAAAASGVASEVVTEVASEVASAVASEVASGFASAAGATAAAATAAPAAVSAPTVAPPAAAAAPSSPASVAPRAPSLGSLISEEDKALARQARQTIDAARAAAAASAAAKAQAAASAASAVPEPPPELPFKRRRRPAPAVPAASAASAAPEAPPARPAAPATRPLPRGATATVFALSTRPLRTRAEAEQVQVAMRSLLRTLGSGEMQVDVLPQRDDWRVVALPFASHADAERARALLVSRGMRVVVVDF
ncbi:MAG: hypothetical protein C0505_06180 [Leptothrix sp. (in: Bacteria)]|nr:hypothetical protein [Leptothrix sp. (in: b-proteobacteria)]